MQRVIRIDRADTVVTCLKAFLPGESVTLDGKTIAANTAIPVYHKLAVAPMPKGSLCRKYGEVIGEALEDIAVGDHVHTHNIGSTRGRGDKPGA